MDEARHTEDPVALGSEAPPRRGLGAKLSGMARGENRIPGIQIRLVRCVSNDPILSEVEALAEALAEHLHHEALPCALRLRSKEGRV